MSNPPAPNPAAQFCRFCGHGPLFSWELHAPGHCKLCARMEHDPVFADDLNDDADEDGKNWGNDE